MGVQVRFAPSPTGRLHVGNIYVALHNWLFARHSNGKFLLRLDDTDRERSTEEFARAIEGDLTWLGLKWDGFARQSDRLDRYDEAARRLRESGRLYPCFETAEELSLKRKVQLSQGRPPIYDRAALRLGEADKAKLLAEGRKPHWRFRLLGERIEWSDLVRGHQHVEESSQSDPVLVREDGTYLYTLTSVVDDIDFAVSHVIRGNDHVTNTATQIQIFRALGGHPPTFAHLPLLVDASGEGLSKRLGALSISELRDQGLEPMAINSYLAHVGSGEPAKPVADLGGLAIAHDLSRFGRSSPRFDPQELRGLNAKLLHQLPYRVALDHLRALGLGEVDEAIWEIARANVERLADAVLWQRICRGEIEPVLSDREFCAAAGRLLPPEPWSAQTWGEWTRAVGQETRRKGRDLFMPLRLALTASDHGPEMKMLLPLIGRDRCSRRLLGERA